MSKRTLQNDPPALSVPKGQRMPPVNPSHDPMEESTMMSLSPFFSALEYLEESEELPFTPYIEADLYGVKSDTICPQCGRLTVVVTLGASPDPSELPCEEFKFFTFFGITELPVSVLKALQEINPNYNLCPTRFTKELVYLNACAACGYVFQDDDLCMEPSDAFRPVWIEDYKRIDLVPLNHRTGYELQFDEYEDRIFDGVEASRCNPAPDLYQVIFEGVEP